MPIKIKVLFVLHLVFIVNLQVMAQELEPRALTNVPVGFNFAVVGYGYARGNILLDPAVPIEGLVARLHTPVVAYVRSINFLGFSGKVDVIVPFGVGHWEGRLEEQDTSTARLGMGDPRIRLSINFIGAPALRMQEYEGYQQKTIAGASIQVIAPLGQYNPEKLLNLGSNRWTFRPQIGIAHTLDQWIIEIYVSSWFFTKNLNFYGGLKLSQNPLFAGKVHLIRTMRKGRWIALDIGYGFGGSTTINDLPRDTHISTIRLGATLAFSLKPQHTVKIVGTSGIRFERGADFDACALTYQYRWGG